jgi:hypothetical protein
VITAKLSKTQASCFCSTWNYQNVWNLWWAGNVVRIATGYGLDGSIPGGGRVFPHLSRPALGPTQPPVQWVTGLSRGTERPGREAVSSSPSSAVGHERVELYLYSPYGLYGLYRASVPVQGCPLPLPQVTISTNYGALFHWPSPLTKDFFFKF